MLITCRRKTLQMLMIGRRLLKSALLRVRFRRCSKHARWRFFFSCTIIIAAAVIFTRLQHLVIRMRIRFSACTSGTRRRHAYGIMFLESHFLTFLPRRHGLIRCRSLSGVAQSFTFDAINWRKPAAKDYADAF